jgi:hypothetical protein
MTNHWVTEKYYSPPKNDDQRTSGEEPMRHQMSACSTALVRPDQGATIWPVEVASAAERGL